MGAERYMILNGELLEWPHVEGAFVYQYIHTLNYAPYNLSQHIKIISQASESLFELPFEYSTGYFQADSLTAWRGTTFAQGIYLRHTKTLCIG